MKKIILLAFIILLAATTSCQKERSDNSETNEPQVITNASTEQKETTNTAATTEKATEPLKLFQADETDIAILDENDYAINDNTTITDELIIYKPILNITDAYPDMTYEFIEFPEDFTPAFCDDNGLWYDNYCKAEGVGGNGMIRQYNHETGELSVLIDPEGNTACSCIGIEGNYLIWEEAKNFYWISCTYYVYNFETGESIKFYEDAINPQTNSSYHGLHFNYPVIIDNKIYFDDTIGINKDGTVHRIVYCYNIIEDTYELMYDNAMWPLEYNGEFSWFSISNDGVNGVLCNQKESIYKSVIRLGSLPGAAGNILFMNDYFSKNDYNRILNKEHISPENIDPDDIFDIGRSSYGVKILRDGIAEPLVLSGSIDGSYVANVKSNGKFITWGGQMVGTPIFYDYEKDAIINVDFFENNELDFYNFEFCKDKLLLNCFDYSGEEQHILISF